jgi:hypothetical protein
VGTIVFDRCWAKVFGDAEVTVPDYAPLRNWIIEREAIRVRKERGCSLPWTTDHILSSYRFCNVRREDDRGTIWVRDHIRTPFAAFPPLWFMLCVARQINWPDTLAELIVAAWPHRQNFEPAQMTAVLQRRKARGEKVYTGAYMISAPATKGADKQSYIAEQVCGDLWRRRDEFAQHFSGSPTLESTHALIRRSNGWGPFMAYQAVVDMRFTALLRNAPDIQTWAAAGPGTIRGLNRLHGRPVGAALSQAQALVEMRAIYATIEHDTGVAMDFSDVPNILCETDKWLRVKNGEGKPRALYVPGRGC